jgi:TolA-binding protein
MNRFLFIGLGLVLGLLDLAAQPTSPQGDKDRLFHTATEQFQSGEYAGCFRALETWLTESPSEAHLEEAHFMRAAAAWELNRRETSLLLIHFLKDWPASPFAEKAYYLLGCAALDAGQYEDAMGFFRRCPESALTPSERVHFRFRYAYLALQLGDTPTARNLFSELATGETRYAASAGFFLAYLDYAAGMVNEATKGFAPYADNEQLNAAVPTFKVQLLYAGGKLQEAINEAANLLNTVQDNVQRIELTRLVAAALFDISEFDKARQVYIEYLSTTPEVHPTDLYRIGLLNYMAGEYERAITRLSQVAGTDDAMGQSASYHLGLCYLKLKKYDQARMGFEQASLPTFDLPTREKALYNYAVLCYETDYAAFNEQVNAFQRFLTAFPTSTFADKANAYLAEALLSSRDYKASLEVVEKVAKPDANLLKTKTRLLFLLGVDHMNNRQFDQAGVYLNQAIDLALKTNQSVTELYYWRGEAYFQQQQYALSQADFKRFTEQPGAKQMKAWGSALYGLGYSLFKNKAYNEALIQFEAFTKQQGAASDVRYVDALNRMGDSYFMTKRYDRAGQQYQLADKATQGGNDYAVYQQALTLGLRKENQAKLTLLNQFEARFPVSDYADDILFEIGKTHATMQDKDQAIAAYERLMDTYPGSPLSRKAGLQIALLHVNSLALEQAKAAYKVVIEAYPGSQEAQTAVSDLKQLHVSTNTVAEFINYTRSLSVPVPLAAGEQDSLTYLAAENLLMDGRNQEAIDAFEAYVGQFPNGLYLADSHYHLAKLKQAKGDVVGAAPHLTYVAGRTGHRYQGECLAILADIYFKQGRFEDALARYTLLVPLATDKKQRLTAETGQLRCQVKLGRDKDVIASATSLLGDQSMDKVLQTEVRYYRAKAYQNTGLAESARSDLQLLSKEVQTVYGAEARFLLAEQYFKQKNLKEAEKVVNQFIQDGTPHAYWLAHAFLLLADIHMERKDDFQAKQYLLSLKENYKTDDDIAGLIEARLTKIAQRNK